MVDGQNAQAEMKGPRGVRRPRDALARMRTGKTVPTGVRELANIDIHVCLQL